LPFSEGARPAAQDRVSIVFDCRMTNVLGHDVIDDFCTSLPKSFHFHEKIDHSRVSALCADDACFLSERTRDDDRNASDHRDYAITIVSKCGGQDMRLPLTIKP
jgi:hypothetical protein